MGPLPARLRSIRSMRFLRLGLANPADVAGWAAAGHFSGTGRDPTRQLRRREVAGLVEVPIAELMPCFPRSGYGPKR